MLAAVPLNLQVHDTFFVVAHFHYVLIGGAIFPLFGAVYYWFPKWTGRMPSESLGRWSFWLVFAGFNLTFFPLHQLGLHGMTRRVYTYAPETGWGPLNLLATVGAFILALGVLMFVVNVLWSRKRGAIAGPNPWGAGTLEWSVASPPPAGNFELVPVVHGRYPLWQEAQEPTHVIGITSEDREILVTSVADAQPDHRLWLPGPTPWPFWSAVATTILFIGSIFTPWAIVWGAVPVAIGATCWFWPKRRMVEKRVRLEVQP